MGVKGLWSLLNPVARPVQIESLDGKRLAIDSSIWLYQFQSTMRDKDGRVLTNAHVLGFLRRINKLLFHGIKPVFVFDGGAPALKRSTIAERKRKKAGAAFNATRMAEKLLQAQMRREALRVTQQAQDARAARESVAGYVPEETEWIPENAIYLDELEGGRAPVRAEGDRGDRAPVDMEEDAEESSRRARKTRRAAADKHDRYYLPAATVPAFSTSERPDARLATEDELRQFIDDVHPEDIDVESPEFRALPTEVQYEIIGDMRVKSRQQSHKRLTEMLAGAPTALDFSKAQIRHLSQRNALTQQLLTVTDMVGKAHLTIPVRVAAERNREYLLMKRGDGGGWALGIREGTAERPIELEPETKADRIKKEKDAAAATKAEVYSDDSESDIEEYKPPPDDELRQHRRREVLEAIARRYAPAISRPSLDVAITPFGKARAPGATPLFDPGDEEATTSAAAAKVTANDEALALALQREELGEGENVADPELARALALSRAEAEEKEKGKEKEKEKEKAAVEATEKEGGTPPPLESDEDEFEEVSLVPSGGGTPAPIVLDDSEDDLELVEAAAPAPTATGQKNPRELTEALIKDSVSAPQARAAPSARTTQAARPSAASLVAMSRPPDVVSVQPSPLPEIHPVQHFSSDEDDDEFEEVAAPAAVSQLSPAEVPQPPPAPSRPSLTEVVKQPVPHRGPSVPSPEPQTAVQRDPWPWSFEHDPFAGMRQDRAPSPEEDTDGPFADMRIERGAPSPSPPPQLIDTEREPEPARLSLPPARSFTYDEDSDDSDDPIEWSRSPTPQPRSDTLQRSYSAAQSAASEPDDEDEQMAPADMAVEEDDYARFLAQIKNRDLNEVRGEIDDEIRILNQQAKAAMRDSDEITQAMVVQIQTLLRHFGIPYITAPMEAEAQCAKLAELGLVDGIITDDSDVFLFGGTQCFKNIFNDAKFAECFLASDIERELSLTRDRLVALSYLLGSDYTLGLPGVGPVMALELLSNFAGPDGLVHFRDWWLRVQNSTDTEEESNTKWKKSFKKRFADTIQISPSWPDPLVREAYLYPTADESDEPFHWGFPRLAALRTFLHDELSWSISKVDDELTPIVQRIAKRGKGALGRQATLLPFFDNAAASATGSGAAYAPRRRTTAGMSKRLMGVIAQFREAEARVPGGVGSDAQAIETDGLEPPEVVVVNDTEEDGQSQANAKARARAPRSKGKAKAKAAPKKRGTKRKTGDDDGYGADDQDEPDLNLESDESELQLAPEPKRRRARRTASTRSATSS